MRRHVMRTGMAGVRTPGWRQVIVLAMGVALVAGCRPKPPETPPAPVPPPPELVAPEGAPAGG